MKNRNFTMLALSLFLVGGFVSGASAETVRSAEVATQMVSVDPSAKPAVADDAAQYAAREQKAEEQKGYRGGDYIVIGVTTGALILALIIVLILVV